MNARRQDVLDIVRGRQDVTATQIHALLVARSWVGRQFGQRSRITRVLGPSIDDVHDDLARLEQDGAIQSRLGNEIGINNYRPRFYSASEMSEATAWNLLGS